MILWSASEYFHGMFTSGLEEATSGVIEIKGTDSETMSALLEYIYSADIQITTDNVESLVQVRRPPRAMLPPRGYCENHPGNNDP